MARIGSKYFWGFTTVLLLVLAAAAIIVPTLSNMLQHGMHQAPASNLSQIAKAYAAYSYGSTYGRKIQLLPGSTAHDAAFILAQKADLNDASMWFIPTDDALANVTLPKLVIDGDLSTATAVAPDFAQLTLSYVFAANVSTSAPSTTTPIAWTRGLQPNGTWSSDSPYNGTGGHIAFLDGHVAWYDKLDATNADESLVVAPGWPNAGTATANITLALPPGAIILPAEPRHTPNP